MHREYRPEQMRLGVPPPAHDHHDHGHSHGSGHDHHDEHEHDPDAERRCWWRRRPWSASCCWPTWCSALVGSPWQRPFGVPLALVGGGDRRRARGLSRPGRPARRNDRRRHRPGDRLHRGRLPGRVFRRRRGRLHRPAGRVPGSPDLRARPAARSASCSTSIPGPRA